jgi:hypothetical protein
MPRLEDNELNRLIQQIQSAIESPCQEERDPKELFSYAVWTVKNIDELVQRMYSGYLTVIPSEERKIATKINILSAICYEVSVAWEAINDGSELEDLGEQALNLILAELGKLDALS